MSNSSAQPTSAETSNTYNVSDEIFAEAQRLGLELIATGGGFDFVYRKFSGWARDSEHEIVVENGMTGQSPKSLKDDANMVVYF